MLDRHGVVVLENGSFVRTRYVQEKRGATSAKCQTPKISTPNPRQRKGSDALAKLSDIWPQVKSALAIR